MILNLHFCRDIDIDNKMLAVVPGEFEFDIVDSDFEDLK